MNRRTHARREEDDIVTTVIALTNQVRVLSQQVREGFIKGLLAGMFLSVPIAFALFALTTTEREVSQKVDTFFALFQ